MTYVYPAAYGIDQQIDAAIDRALVTTMKEDKLSFAKLMAVLSRERLRALGPPFERTSLGAAGELVMRWSAVPEVWVPTEDVHRYVRIPVAQYWSYRFGLWKPEAREDA